MQTAAHVWYEETPPFLPLDLVLFNKCSQYVRCRRSDRCSLFALPIGYEETLCS